MEKIDQILDSLYDRVIEPIEAKQQLLDLFGVMKLPCPYCGEEKEDSNDDIGVGLVTFLPGVLLIIASEKKK
jgi:hypothetical protein